MDQSHWKRGNTHTHIQYPHSVWDVSESLDHVALLLVFQIRDDKVKLSFSMKSVNQGTGRDLDPNNVMAE